VYDKYFLYPIINRDALKQWWDISKNGINSDGKGPEYSRNNESDGDYYRITERISSFYLMNTLNWGENITFIAGVRAEIEDNDYMSKFSPSPLTGFPTPTGTIKDTSAHHNETIWLPNFHLTFRPTEDINIRLAAYGAIARPDFNQRLNSFIARNSGNIGSTNSVTLDIGNPRLKAAKAMNYEVNASYYNRIFGFMSFSAFYKEIKDMYHMVNGVQTVGNRLLDSLGIPWRSPFVSGTLYALTYPYNSADPTKVWGFEFEHQANLRFLPGLLSGLVLSYNFSIVRSETYVMSSHIDSVMVKVPGWPFPVASYYTVIDQKKQKLEGQPEFYGNVAVGYDVGGFSARLSFFFQGEYVTSFSADGRSDQVQGKFTRLDLALKYEYSDNLSFFLNLNNITNTEECTYIRNKYLGADLLDTSEKYNFTSDLGIRITL
jgi:TonB-dependent receptor